MVNKDKDCHLDVIRLVNPFRLCFKVSGVKSHANDYKAISRGRFQRSSM